MSRPGAAPAPADRRRHAPADVFAAGLRNHHVSNTAYPIAHERTWAPYRVPRAEQRSVAVDAWRGIDDLCLYVHVPFCETRCAFCEYTVTKRDEHVRAGAYVDDLLREFDLWGEAIGTRSRTLRGFDIGGGTPAFLSAVEIGRIVEKARASFRFADDADVSIETTPKLAAEKPERLTAYRDLGIDRISMGIQVIQPDLLRVLNREANGVDKHFRAVTHLRAAGFERFNVDLMYGFAGQAEESWRATLRHAIALCPESITLYRMRYKLTRISHQAPRVTLEAIRPLQRIAKELLAAAGFHANPGKTTWSRDPQDVGTSAYLARRVTDGTPYLGLGLGAQSFTDSTISYNDGAAGKSLAPYGRSVAAGRLPLQDLYDLPLRQMAGKFCAVSFYFGEIDLASFERKFGVRFGELYADEVEFVLGRGLMRQNGCKLSLTPEGTCVQSGVIALFFAPSIQEYLIERDPMQAEDMHRNRRAALAVAGAEA